MILWASNVRFAVFAPSVHCVDPQLAGLQVVPNPPTRFKPRANAALTLEDYPLAVGGFILVFCGVARLDVSGVAHPPALDI
jgi:hypothetical protein